MFLVQEWKKPSREESRDARFNSNLRINVNLRRNIDYFKYAFLYYFLVIFLAIHFVHVDWFCREKIAIYEYVK